MNKQDLIRKIAADSGITQKQADAALGAAINAVMNAVSSGEKVQIVGFGTFEPKSREARTGYNPRTREPIEIASSTIPVFKPSKVFKNSVNK